MWVSSVNYASDVCIGPSVIKQCFDSYRKLRNTARYILGNLHDYKPEEHAVPFNELPQLDQYMLGLLSEFMREVKEAYDGYVAMPAVGGGRAFACGCVMGSGWRVG